MTEITEAYLYARVSNKRQHVERQTDYLSMRCEAKGIKLCGVFTDVGKKGYWTVGKRPGLKALLDACEKRPLPVIVEDIDRLVRGDVEYLDNLLAMFSERGSKVYRHFGHFYERDGLHEIRGRA